MADQARLAVYAAPPPGSGLAERAEQWFRDAEDRTGIGDLTGAARHYGFHGTLVPPFHPAADHTHGAILDAVAELAACRSPVTVPALVVGTIGRFVALVPRVPVPALDELAAVCLAELDQFRARPPERELARRREAGLSARQDELLTSWGYPYVLDEFRFHLTLSRTLAPSELDAVVDLAREWFGELDGSPFELDALCVFEQSAAERGFVEVARYPLLGGA